ncbi:hypothetical protein [Conyzicola sp.]|uniref:hypothetical protein n=1 Tax=Conyzicola sp. TaxID=1969404 RepID=UPI00398916DB
MAMLLALFVWRPEMRVVIAGGLFVLLILAAVLIFVVTRVNRVSEAIRLAAAPGWVVFAAYNHPGALVHVGDYLVPGVDVARGLGLIVVADDAGLSYLTPDRPPQPFVQIPWSGIDDIAEVGGELAVGLANGDVQYIVPGARIPVAKRRVRAIAEQLSALQPQRQL